MKPDQDDDIALMTFRTLGVSRWNNVSELTLVKINVLQLGVAHSDVFLPPRRPESPACEHPSRMSFLPVFMPTFLPIFFGAQQWHQHVS